MKRESFGARGLAGAFGLVGLHNNNISQAMGMRQSGEVYCSVKESRGERYTIVAIGAAVWCESIAYQGCLSVLEEMQEISMARRQGAGRTLHWRRRV